MAHVIPPPDRLPCTADHYLWRGKPAALIPGRCGVIYDETPRLVPWTELLRNGKPISQSRFRMLLSEQE
jgi:hypothetical protein